MAIGVGVTPLTSAATAVRLAQMTEQLGYSFFGAADGWTYDAFALLGHIAAKTSRIELETGVISIWSRSPATLAMGATTLQTVSAGRFCLGLGTSSQPLVEGLHGSSWDRPLSRMRATVGAIQAMLGGERSPCAAEGTRALRLGALPEQPVPMMLAGLTPRSVRLAGELADRWLPFMWARSRVEDGRALLAEGEARAADPTPTNITAAVPVALGEDEQTARTLAAIWLMTYLTRMGPLYPDMLRKRFGFNREVEVFLAANADGGVPCLPAGAERLAREVTLMASYDEAASALRAWCDAPVNDVALILPGGLPATPLVEMLQAAAPATPSNSHRRKAVENQSTWG
jgi:alkanesulfonate monooxygenase SsuD/methylene tetrahydromethanopterin reductase-like flavin-dependent oxidoreductase (luciferase family)